MSATLLADRGQPEAAGSTLRLYVPALEPVPRLGPAPCGFAGCPLRATHVEHVGTIHVALLCEGHRLEDPER